MKKSLFENWEYNREAWELYDTIKNFIEPIMISYLERGYSLKDIKEVCEGVISNLEFEMRDKDETCEFKH